MNNLITAHADEAGAQQLFLAKQVNIFLFDLKNEASEHGFSANETWSLQLATQSELAQLKKDYYPLITTKLNPGVLLEVYQQVKNRLKQTLSHDEASLTERDLTRDDKTYLAAYCVKNTRK